ncbi:glycosyltransferase [Nocardioides humi]|uniref:Glycosyltransferase n=1 Tax=Nocardioides humi TaxID=449461 RepID=A0ABN2ATL1_9ACTN|nr:glycosyltransferase [Nocardioides humi]
MRVVHLVESVGGGVLSSVLTMVDATPDIEHHLLTWPRRDHADTGDGRHLFGSTSSLSRRPLSAVRGLRAAVDLLSPDHLHAHSSYAGMLARSVELGVDVVYSPHCFAFERRDIGTVMRSGIRRVERSLIRRTAVLVACSPHEAALARNLGHRRVVTVPNRALTPPDARARHAASPRIVTVGRVGAQKDWRHLLAAKRAFDSAGLVPARWEWLGGGDARAEAELRDGGVAVSGWLPREDVVRRLASAQAYVHTAAWEGAPVSIIEAAAVGLPIVARRIPTLESLGVPGLAATPEDIALRLVGLHEPGLWAAEQQSSLAFAAEHSVAAQRRRLDTVYQHTPAAALIPS